MTRLPLIDRLGLRAQLEHMRHDCALIECMHAVLDRVEAIERIMGIKPGACVLELTGNGVATCRVHQCIATRSEAGTHWECEAMRSEGR